VKDDIRQIKEALTIPEVLARYGHHPKGKATRGGQQLHYLCPFHEEKEASFTVDTDKGEGGLYKCFGCDKGGDVITLVAQLEGVETKEAIRLCREWAGITPAPQKATGTPTRPLEPHGSTQATSTTPAKDTAALYENLEELPAAALKYLEGRGISADTAALGGIRWISKAQAHAHGLPDSYGDRLALPLYLAGKVVQVQARGMWPIGAEDKPPAALNLPEEYGPMDGLAGHLEGRGPVVLCEAPIDALSVLEAFPGISAVAVGGGSGLQERAVTALAGRLVYLLPDHDTAGDGHRAKWKEALEGRATVRDITLPPGQDANDLLQEGKAALHALINKALASRRRELFETGRDYLEEFRRRPEPWPTGLPPVDTGLAGGLLPDHLYVLLGDTGSGKTALAHQLAQGMAKAERPVLYVSLEMGRYVLWARTISRLSYELREAKRISYAAPYLLLIHSKGRDPSFRDNVAEVHRHYLEEIASSFSVLEGPQDTDGIRARARELEEATGLPPAVYVDYLQLIRPTEAEQKGRLDVRLRMDNALAALRGLANELHTPVLVISAKGRGAYGDANIAGGKESGGIEYTADFLLDLAPKLEPEPPQGELRKAVNAALLEDTGPRILRVLKERDGRGRQEIALTFHRSQGRFT